MQQLHFFSLDLKDWDKIIEVWSRGGRRKEVFFPAFREEIKNSPKTPKGNKKTKRSSQSENERTQKQGGTEHNWAVLTAASQNSWGEFVRRKTSPDLAPSTDHGDIRAAPGRIWLPQALQPPWACQDLLFFPQSMKIQAATTSP